MNRFVQALPTDGQILSLFHPLGIFARILPCLVNPNCYTRINIEEFKRICDYIGPKALPLILSTAIFISLALSIETVLETTKYGAQDSSGAAISIGLLRELGPLTVSIFWAARTTVLLSYNAKLYVDKHGHTDFIEVFVFPRFIAAIMMAVPLASYGLVFGFATAALYAPTIGVSSWQEFLEIARVSIHEKDIITYFVKLIVLNPIIAVCVGSACGLYSNEDGGTTASHAVSKMFIYAVIANFIFTYFMFPV